MTITTDYTSAEYNSFMSEAEADVLIPELEVIYGSMDWLTLTTAEKESWLKYATVQVNDIDWNGALNAAVIAPNMTFPRSGLTYKTGQAVDPDSVPNDIKNYMTCVIINTAINGTTTTTGGSTPNITTGEIKSKTVGDVTIQYTTSADTGGTSPTTTTTEGLDSNVCLDTYIYSGWLTGDTSELGLGSICRIRGLC